MVIEDGVLKRVESSEIIDGEFVVPEGVEDIGCGVFFGCSNLTKITIPEGVKNIGENAFERCSNLTEIIISEGVEYIGESAFSGCSNLTEITIPEGVKHIGESAFSVCSNLTEIIIPEGVKHIGDRAFYGCSNLTKIIIPEGVEYIGDRAFSRCRNLIEIPTLEEATEMGEDVFYGCVKLSEMIIKARFADVYDKIEQIKSKANFHISQDFDEYYMNLLYFEMFGSIGIDEVERIVEIPNLTPEEIQNYTLEKDEAFNYLYDTKYHLKGELGLTLEILKKLDLSSHKKPKEGKNTQEMKLFKSLNQKLEEGYEGNLTDLVNSCLKEQNIEINSEWLEQIRDFEKSLNKVQINETLQKMNGKIGEALGTPTENYPEAIVAMQIEPIQAMVEDTIRKLFQKNGSIDLETLHLALDEKIANAHAPYIVQHKQQIVNQVLEFLQKNEVFQKGIQKSPLNALKHTKEKIGGAWKYKLNQTLKEMGYSFSNLPSEFSKEEMEKFSNLIAEQEIQAEPVSVLKEEADREVAYRLLAEKDLPKLVTYKQLHDMFFSVHAPYSEEFKKYFKQHREEFLEKPEYYGHFGRIHNHFETIIQDPKLKNIYEKGELSVEQIVGYLKEKNFDNQRPGDEELAQLSSSVGTISTEEEFAGVQKIFDITRKRERTSIPPTSVTKSRFRGRMLVPDDVLNLFAGDITTCCQRFNDVGEGSMLIGSIEENAGIFVVEELDENGKPTNIVGQSLTIRQKGESGGYDRLTFDNIEITDTVKKRLSKEEQAEILEVYKQAGKDAIEKDKKFLQKQLKRGNISQEQYDSLVLKEVIAGTGYNDLYGLEDQPMAKTVVADEARNTYHSIKGQAGHPWIDSAGGQAPTGSKGKPVILVEMPEEEKIAIQERKADAGWKVKIKPKEVPLWYGKVGEVQTLSDEQITEDKIEKIKKIERIVFREEQQLLNHDEVQTVEDLEYAYGMDNMQVKLGSNEDWYLIYGEDEKEITISDLALVGGVHSQKNEDLPKANTKLAIAESTTEIYKLLLKASQDDKTIYCNATEDTSFINIKKMLQKGLIDVKDKNGRNLEYSENGLVYEQTAEKVKGRDWSYNSEIQMYDLEIIPHQTEIEEALEQSEKWLVKVQESIQMEGKEKEPGLEELKNQIRKEWQDKNDEK